MKTVTWQWTGGRQKGIVHTRTLTEKEARALYGRLAYLNDVNPGAVLVSIN